MFADERRLAVLADKLRYQPFGLAELGAGIRDLCTRYNRRPVRIGLPAGGMIDCSGSPVLMGVLNVTPDSFSDGGAFLDPKRAVARAHEMVEEGAGVIDIGAESTRPGAAAVSAAEEIDRIGPVLDELAGALPVPLSIDTRTASVARHAVAMGAAIINDISALSHDPQMIDVARESGAAVVAMHMQGTPETMQDDPRYDDAVSEIIDWLAKRTEHLIEAGIEREKIIVDPGIGFGKRLRDNLEIINEIGDFHNLGFPVLVGFSRKSFIGTITGRSPADRTAGGFAALAKCLDHRIQMLRVHDVGAARDFCRVWLAIERRGL
jgi:dihydropteroate synthase